MYQSVTKKRLLQGMKLCKDHGYWSSEVREYIERFYYPAQQKMHEALISLYNSPNYKASSLYSLAMENNMIDIV